MVMIASFPGYDGHAEGLVIMAPLSNIAQRVKRLSEYLGSPKADVIGLTTGLSIIPYL